MNISLITFDNAPLSYAAGVIAEGLIDLGHSVKIHSGLTEIFFGSATIFRPKDDNFEKFDSIEDAFKSDFLIFDVSYTSNLNTDVISPFSSKSVVLDMSDSAPLRNFSKGLSVFTSHLNCRMVKYKDNNFFPLPFGISKDLIDKTKNLKNLKNKSLIHNFTPSSNQSVRAALSLSLIPNLSKIFHINYERKSGLDYLENMNTASAVLAYCGDFVQDLQKNSYLKERGVANTDIPHSYYFESFIGDSNIARWDSWRFYEACICSTVPIQLEFERYGFQLSNNPIPWEHYIPIDLEKLEQLPEEIIKRIELDKEFLSNCGINAKKWALDNFGPIGMANYIFNTINI